MRVEKIIAGLAVAAAAALVLTACGSGGHEPVTLASGSGANSANASSTTTPTTTTTEAPATTTEPPATTEQPPATPVVPKPEPAMADPTKQPAVGAPCNASARACVDLSGDQAWLLQDGKVTYGPVPITSGKPGHRTPPGTFHVQWKDRNHKSKAFNDAPMPNSVFFYSGMAFHTGSLRAESHGCVHLSSAASLKFFSTLSVGDVVQVVS